MNKKIFKHVFLEGRNLGIKFGEFRSILERSDFSDISEENLKLKNMPLIGEESLLTSLNIDGEDQKTISEIGSSLPGFSLLFSQKERNTTKAIDLFKAEVEAMKKAISNFEKSFNVGITGKEVEKEYETTIPGIDKMLGDTNVTQAFINNTIRVFTRSIAGTGPSSSIDDFVSSDSGKNLVKLLKGLKVDTPLPRLIDSIFNPVISKLETQDLTSVMNSLDSIDMDEINSRNSEAGTVNDYLSGSSGLSELEMAKSMDPYVRLGLFYQLCLLQNQGFISKVTSDVKGTKLNYPDFLINGKPFEESLKTLFGRNADLSALDPFMESLNELSLSMIDSTWNTPESDRIKTILFVPAVQVFYVALMNFVLANALYTFLTKKTGLVYKTREEATKRKDAEAAKAQFRPSLMADVERGRKIAGLFAKNDLKDLLRDQTIYTPSKSGYDPEKIKALKELVYYMFGGKITGLESVKTWDISKNPLDGNYDQFFSNIIRDIQTKFGVPPLKNGIGDGKVGPVTKRFFSESIPLAIAELVQ